MRSLSAMLDDKFQSTLPVGGGTLCNVYVGIQNHISIHPPRGGRDWTSNHN